MVLKRKLFLFVCNPCIMCMLRKIFEFNLAVNFLYFLSNWVNMLGIFSGIRKLKTFQRNSCFWNSYLMPWRWMIELLWQCWKILLKSFRNKTGRKKKQGALLLMISCISTHFWSITIIGSFKLQFKITTQKVK